MTAHNITFSCDAGDYEWGGGYGGLIYSYERGRQVGDTRMICGVLFHVFQVYAGYPHRSFWQRPRVCWTIDNPTSEKVADIRKKVLG